jgi:hypothetical protein
MSDHVKEYRAEHLYRADAQDSQPGCRSVERHTIARLFADLNAIGGDGILKPLRAALPLPDTKIRVPQLLLSPRVDQV